MKFAYVRSQVNEDNVASLLFRRLPPSNQSKLATENAAQVFRAHFLIRLKNLVAENTVFASGAKKPATSF